MNVLDYFITRKEEKTMKKIRIAAAVAAMAMALTACGANAGLKKTAMKIGDMKVTAGDIAVMTKAEMAYMGSDFATVKPMIVEQMETIFKYGELGKAMKLELTDEEKNSAISMRAQYAANGGGFDAYEKYLKNNASSIEFLDELFTASAYATKVQEKINEGFEDKEATDDELKKFYEDEYMCVKHILIKVGEEGIDTIDAAKKKADEIIAELNNGGDFETLMKTHSHDKDDDGNENSGETGYVFTAGDFGNPAFEDASAALSVGEYTKEAVKVEGGTYSGYHIILRLELPAFEDQKETVSASYSTKRTEKSFEDLLKEYGIEVEKFQDVIDAITEEMLTESPVKEDDVSVSY